MNASDPYQPQLSGAGESRREAILVAALGEAARLRRRRKVRRAAYRSAGLALVAIAGWIGTHWPKPEPPRTVVAAPNVQPTNPAPGVTPPGINPSRINPPARIEVARPEREVVITRIVTEPDISQRLSIPRTLPPVQRLDDAGLLRELAMQGYSSGVIIRHGRSELWWELPRAPR